MKVLIVAFIFVVNSVCFALPPPQGKSMRNDRDFTVTDVPTGSLLDAALDLPRRLELRAKKVEEINSIRKQPAIPQTAKQPVKVGAKSKEKTFEKMKSTSKSNEERKASNLPNYYSGQDLKEVKASDQVVYVSENGHVGLNGLKSGDVVKAVIEQKIKASPSVATPIRAIAISSHYKGAYFLGEATLDRELKRVLLSFGKLRLKSTDQVYSLKASGLSSMGSVGLEGEYHSQTGQFFLAELASATAAGIVDATIHRQQNSYGGYVQEPSFGNSAKQGAVTALARTTDRAAESVRQAPEYTETQGFQEVQIIIQDDPVEIN